jgi:hypothetical protein
VNRRGREGDVNTSKYEGDASFGLSGDCSVADGSRFSFAARIPTSVFIAADRGHFLRRSRNPFDQLVNRHVELLGPPSESDSDDLNRRHLSPTN